MASIKCLIAGHRGAASLAPENTLKAFKIGLENADAVECDVRLTKDGVFAVMHDSDLRRTANRDGKVKDYTMAELAEFDAGDGEKIPSLSDALKLTAAFGKTLIIEIKTEDGERPEAAARALQKTFSAFGSLPQIIVCSFNHETLKSVRNLIPKIIIAATMKEGMTAGEIESEMSGLDTDGVSVEFHSLSRELAAKIKARGMFLQAWVVNKEEDFKTMLKMGVDWIYTDFPGRWR